MSEVGARGAGESDLELLRRIQRGDTRAIEALYDRYTPLLYPVVHRILRSAPDAEDALQEAWVQVWRSAATYNAVRGSVGAWLVTVARSRALDRARSVTSRRRGDSQTDLDPPASPPDAADAPARLQLAEQVRGALDSLDPKHRRVLESAYFDGLSQTEIAERLKTPLGLVKSWTRQALLRLRELMPHEERV